MVVLFILVIALLIAGLSVSLILERRVRPGSAANRQIAKLMERVDQLEQNAVSATNELRRLEDSQRFTERLLANRSVATPSLPPASTPTVPPDSQ
ncbi:MAG: hypothetical protein ABIR58_00020 [Gemmatimonadaceae bacterium]